MTSTATASKAAPAAIVTITIPQLADGEIYAGILLDEVGKPQHHLVLLPEHAKALPWKKAIEWATKQGGGLPTRREQSLLFANAKQHFEPDWYWSSESDAGDAAWAWIQRFNYGYQYGTLKGRKGRARAVRRVPIE